MTAYSVVELRRIVVCTGPRCVRKGRRLVKMVQSQSDCAVIPSRCLRQCGWAPVIIVYPEGAWYGGTTPHQVQEILQSHPPHGVIACTKPPDESGSLEVEP